MGHPVDQVRHEVALLGRHVNWGLREVMELDHGERSRWVYEVTGLVEAEEQS